MSELKYYLVHQYHNFYDPHGTPELGDSIIITGTSDEYIDIDPCKTYWKDELIEFKDGDDNDIYATDGYNHTEVFYEFLEITKNEYYIYTNIIEAYNKLYDLIPV